MSRTARALVIGIGVVLVVAALATGALVFFSGMGIMGYRFGFMGPGFMRGFGFETPWLSILLRLLVPVLIIGAIIWLVVALVSGSGQQRTNLPAPSSESPLDILKRRYAKGEITKEQFEQMKTDLGV